VEKIMHTLNDELAMGNTIMLHLAPPCATFSRARDRSWKTRIRSRKFPGGIPGRRHLCREANKIAESAFYLAEWAGKKGIAVTVENPKNSYLWTFIENTSIAQDVVFSPCCFGGKYRKPTRIRCWNWLPTTLDKALSKR
jgi:hypothetical protein